MCTCMYVYIHIYIYTYIHTYIHTHTHTLALSLSLYVFVAFSICNIVPDKHVCKQETLSAFSMPTKCACVYISKFGGCKRQDSLS